jgi:hypothetical protein
MTDGPEIYVDNVVWIYRLLYSKVGNRPDAEDLTTEVFLAALGPLRRTATRVQVRAYLAATARTVLAGYWRRRLGVQVTNIDPELAVSELDDPSTRSLAPARARAVLATLPERHRRVLELRFSKRDRFARQLGKWESASPMPRSCNTGRCAWRPERRQEVRRETSHASSRPVCRRHRGRPGVAHRALRRSRGCRRLTRRDHAEVRPAGC